MPLRARRAERARHAPSALNLTFKVYFYLSLPVVKERPLEGCPPGTKRRNTRRAPASPTPQRRGVPYKRR